MNIFKRIITMIWIRFHFAIKTLIYGDKRELRAKAVQLNSEPKS